MKCTRGYPSTALYTTMDLWVLLATDRSLSGFRPHKKGHACP